MEGLGSKIDVLNVNFFILMSIFSLTIFTLLMARPNSGFHVIVLHLGPV